MRCPPIDPMSSSDSNSSAQPDASVREAAARWVVRHDRGLSSEEEEEFNRWLLADPRNASALARTSHAWRMLDRAPANVVHAVADASGGWGHWRWSIIGGFAAAAVIAIFVFGTSSWREYFFTSQEAGASAPVPPSEPQFQRLPDGTFVRLNIGAEIRPAFTESERRVNLVRGEAHFTVTPDSARPFVVHAGGAVVRAVGTAFNVHLQAAAVDVLVTEGKVQVHPPGENDEPAARPAGATASAGLAPSEYSLVVAGQRAVVTLASNGRNAEVVISNLAPMDVVRALAWREPLMRLGGATLSELASEFHRQTGRRLVLTEPSLEGLRIGGRFRSDDIEGFIRVLEEIYGIKSERAPDGTIFLAKGPE